MWLKVSAKEAATRTRKRRSELGRSSTDIAEKNRSHPHGDNIQKGQASISTMCISAHNTAKTCAAAKRGRHV